MANILITGGNGQLGQCLASFQALYPEHDYTITDVDDLNICNGDEIIEFTKEGKFDYLINCAAYTAVDKAEHEQVAAKKINADAVKNIGVAAKLNNFKVIHISTDYVFDGRAFKPYSEDAVTIPESFYGQSKLLGEKFLLEEQPDSMVIRTAWLYSEFGNNFVKTMLKLGQEREELKIVADQIGSPTYAKDLAEVVLEVITKIEKDSFPFEPGIYHYSNEGVCSWYDFTINIHELAGIDCNISPIESKEYPTAAPRPHYSVLGKNKIKENYKINIPYWRTSLEKCLKVLVAKQ
ncbi:dTDP-4-dehydrorhamnose reductase [Labilibacter marinus]|uniref:dTDP-4-dehydrorhamnose reductase n=1 Tax=Labilibacter marinus TaxID=1477105 RepID=UPI000836916E|nr:dTDP-4-dehydrorhamnose reductase [Labilibacter marinus]